VKNKVSFLGAILLLSELSFAGGDVLPVEEPVIVESSIDESGLYLGLGISAMKLNNDFSKEEFSSTGVTLQAGYQFNQYFAVEGRYTKNVGDLEYDHGNTNNPNYSDYPGDFSNVAVYLKPMYSFDDFSVYALLGYGEVTLTDLPHPSSAGSVDRAEDGFQWGLGAQYTFMENVSVFVDYVKLYDDKGFDYRAQLADIDSDIWTLGVSYRF